MKKLFLAVIIGFLFFGCASRKTKKESLSVDLETKKENNITTNSGETNTGGGNVNFGRNSWRFEPVDPLLPMTFGGTQFTNTKIINEKDSTIVNYHYKDSTFINIKDLSKEESDLKIDQSKKESDRLGQETLIIYLAVLGIIIYLLYDKIKRK